jgi:hypothetical protein
MTKRRSKIGKIHIRTRNRQKIEVTKRCIGIELRMTKKRSGETQQNEEERYIKLNDNKPLT